MNGGLSRVSISRLALVAAAGLFMGGMAMPSAKAADLGGDCCADLEERVAELEATTARKGNRRMSLTVSGQVHRMVLWWDDGQNSGTYYGIDNTNSSTRFNFTGSAKVTGKVSMGFQIQIEIEAGGTSSKLSQFDEDGKVGSQIGGPGSFNQANADSYFGDAREAAWWIDHKDIGKLTVGRTYSAGVQNTIDLGGISAGASSSMILVNGGFSIRSSASGGFTSVNWGSIGDPAASDGRTELVRYDTPTFAGFQAAASIGERGDYWGAQLRYAGEFSGFRLAAGIGYENVSDKATGTTADPTDQYGALKPEVEAWGGSVAVMHVPSGLFAQGHYMASQYSCNGATASGYWGQFDCKSDSDQWLVQAGIAKNWTGLGNTALYGEYSVSNGWGSDTTALGKDYAAAGTKQAVFGVTDTKMTVYGLGITQHIDAAATELYLGWRHFAADITCNGTGADCSGAAVAPDHKMATEDFDAVIGGARVKF